MITPRRSRDRGHTKIDWLESYHTFSFDHFHDPKFMHFRYLRVLNEDWVRPGDIQRMSAGTGITHSEFNPSETDPVHLLQIWFLPSERGLAPSYEQKNFARGFQPGKFQPIADNQRVSIVR